jgi:C1A family cysteine protease
MGNSNSILNEYKKYGWKSDKVDLRDHYHSFTQKNEYESIIDLRTICPKIYNQGKLGSCTANGIAFSYHFDEYKQNNSDIFIPSRLFIYYNEREMEGSTYSDSGAEIRDGIKSISKQGVCNETEWKYDITKFTERPDEECYKNALSHKAIKYKRVRQNLNDIKSCLSTGLPIVFGFIVYESFESDSVTNTGIVPMPKPTENELGGHCVVIVGYNEEKQQFIVRNSWGEQWGDNGYCYFPYNFILNEKLCSDFWTLQKISSI